jgi:hypothetical protein
MLCLALYTLAEGKIMRGFMVSAVAWQIGVSFEEGEEMAASAAKAGLVRHEVSTVTLTGEGQSRGCHAEGAGRRPAAKGDRPA